MQYEEPSAVRRGDCPECGRDLEGVDLEAHANYHWPTYYQQLEVDNPEAYRRKLLVLEGGE